MSAVQNEDCPGCRYLDDVTSNSAMDLQVSEQKFQQMCLLSLENAAKWLTRSARVRHLMPCCYLQWVLDPMRLLCSHPTILPVTAGHEEESSHAHGTQYHAYILTLSDICGFYSWTRLDLEMTGLESSFLLYFGFVIFRLEYKLLIDCRGPRVIKNLVANILSSKRY